MNWKCQHILQAFVSNFPEHIFRHFVLSTKTYLYFLRCSRCISSCFFLSYCLPQQWPSFVVSYIQLVESSFHNINLLKSTQKCTTILPNPTRREPAFFSCALFPMEMIYSVKLPASFQANQFCCQLQQFLQLEQQQTLDTLSAGR